MKVLEFQFWQVDIKYFIPSNFEKKLQNAKIPFVKLIVGRFKRWWKRSVGFETKYLLSFLSQIIIRFYYGFLQTCINTVGNHQETFDKGNYPFTYGLYETLRFRMEKCHQPWKKKLVR